MIKPRISAIIWSFFIWIAAISFFMVFGADLLLAPEEESFLLLWVALEIVTALLLYVGAILYARIHPAPDAGLAFGVYGSTVGLLLDALVIWQHSFFFPSFSQGQLLAFVIWMSFAYGLYLVIPQWVDRRSMIKHNQKG